MAERASDDPRIGSLVLERYRITRLIATGGMGAVYEARHDRIGRRFAVKFLRAELANDEKTLARFEQEAMAAGALESENLCAILDVGSTPDGAPCLVMEYLGGQSLAELLQTAGALPIPRAVEIVRQVCRGLWPAHERRIVHRDLKPNNLIVCRDGRGRDLVKIVDFGIAKLAGHKPVEASNTTTGATLGTPHYMSPEQARGEKRLDERTDIYALGVILYELLTAEKPHPGDSYNAIIYHILSKQPRPVEELRPEVPGGLARVVHRAMSAEVEQRFASVIELERALAKYGPHGSVQLSSNDETQRATVAKAPRHRRVIVLLCTVTTLIAVGVLLIAPPKGEAAHPAAAEPPSPSATPAAAQPLATPSSEPIAVPAKTSESADEASAPVARQIRKKPTSRPAASSSSTPTAKRGFDWNNPYE